MRSGEGNGGCVNGGVVGWTGNGGVEGGGGRGKVWVHCAWSIRTVKFLVREHGRYFHPPLTVLHSHYSIQQKKDL